MRISLAVLVIFFGVQLFASNQKTEFSKQLDSLTLIYKSDISGAEQAVKLIISKTKTNKELVYFNAQSLLGNIQKFQGHFKASLNTHRIAKRGKNNLNDVDGVALCFVDIAAVYSSMGEFELSFSYLDSGITQAKALNNYDVLSKAFLNKGNLWQYEKGNSTKALENYFNGLNALNKAPDYDMMANICMGLGNVHAINKNYDSSRVYFNKALRFYRLSNSLTGQSSVLQNIGINFLENDQLDSTSYYFEKALGISIQVNNVGKEVVLVLNLNELYCRQNEAEKGAKLINQLLKKKEQISLIDLKTCYIGLSNYYDKVEKYDSALFYYKQYDFIKDSINQAEKFRNINGLEAKYKNEKLRAEKLEAIGISEKTKAKNRILMLAAAVLAAMFLLVGAGAILYRQKLQTNILLAEKNEIIHEQKLNELIKEKQLERMTALMEGQEKERTRVARELHDSLGAILATLKHHFALFEKQMGSTDQKYQKAYGLLEKASSEVRRISHNIASNVLSKFGLVAALHDLAQEVTDAGKTVVNVKEFGLESRLENSVEIHVFRIVQELVGNALKHANAAKISIQVTMHQNELNVMVEDNGVGFDLEKSRLDKGMGMQNLMARVKHLKGDFNMDSTIGKGTTAIINVPIAAD